MGNHSRVGVLLVTLLSAVAAASAGCSSMESTNDAGGGGRSGTGSLDPCQSLLDDYAAAFAAARTCNPFLDNIQCAQRAQPGLLCASCPLVVSDTTRLDAIRAQYEARTDCLRVPCPGPHSCPIAVIGTGQCVANDGGPTGSCM